MGLKGHLNSSGFPLQIAIRNLVDSTTSQHNWTTKFTEHSWSDNGSSGFIDLILKKNGGVETLIVECKRVQDSSWIFLVENVVSNKASQVKSFVLDKGAKVHKFQWSDVDVKPITFESEFCVIPSSSGHSNSLIERVAAELVLSTEALANETIQLSPEDKNIRKIYYNVLVTTAKIQVCVINPNEISISDGTIENPVFDEVPYIRFRKQLLSTVNITNKYENYQNHEIAKAKESTILVINSEHFLEFLCNFDWFNNHKNNQVFR